MLIDRSRVTIARFDLVILVHTGLRDSWRSLLSGAVGVPPGLFGAAALRCCLDGRSRSVKPTSGLADHGVDVLDFGNGERGVSHRLCPLKRLGGGVEIRSKQREFQLDS